MSRFSELSSYKNKIIIKLLSDQNFAKAIKYPVDDFLDQPLIDNPYALTYNNIFPYRHTLSNSDAESVIVTMAFTDYKPIGLEFKAGVIYFYVICHKNLIRSDYGFLRTDYIINRIDEAFNKSKDIGIGKLEFDSMNDIAINDSYVGVSLGYRIVEFS